MRPALLVLPVIMLAVCSPANSSGPSASEPSGPWPNFAGRTVPAGTPTYIAGIDAAGGVTWLSEGWFTTGHSHTGLFKSEAGSPWTQVLGWDGWPRWQKTFDAANVVILAEFEEPGYQLHARLLSTTDGGTAWRARDLPAGLDSTIASVDFIDPNHGWLMVELGSSGSIGCGQIKESIEILRTSDGGASWSQALRVDAQHPNAGGVSLEGFKDGLSFRSDSSGYLTTSDVGAGNVAYSTDDGGATWTNVLLPFDQSAGVAVTSAPVWLSADAGLMSVKISPRSLAACFIQRSPVASPPPPSPGPWSVEAPSSLVAPYPGGILLHTSNGGASWSTVDGGSRWGDITSISALDANSWAIASGASLWLTADAGSTWRTLENVLDPRCTFSLVRLTDRSNGLASAFCTDTPGVVEGCEQGADYKSDWDCPPIGTPLFVSHDEGSTWSGLAKPDLK